MKDRISDEMVTEILKEATRLQTKANQGMSMAELEQICSEAGIPPMLMKQAVQEVKNRHIRQRERRERLRALIQQKAKIVLSAGTKIFIPTLIVVSLFLYRSKLNSLFYEFVNQFTGEPPKGQRFNQAPQLDLKVSQIQKDLLETTKAQKDLESEFRDQWLLSNAQVGKRDNKNSEKVFWGDFRDKITGYTEKEVLHLVGKPAKKSHQGLWTMWYYEHVEDLVTGHQGLAVIQFKQGVATGTSFSMTKLAEHMK